MTITFMLMQATLTELSGLQKTKINQSNKQTRKTDKEADMKTEGSMGAGLG